MLYFASRETVSIPIPPQLPRDRVHAIELGHTHISPTAADVQEVNDHLTVQFVDRTANGRGPLDRRPEHRQLAVGQRLESVCILLRSVPQDQVEGCDVYTWDAERSLAGSYARE